jgi:hypothetical protein
MSAELEIDPGDPAALFDYLLSLSARGGAEEAARALDAVGVTNGARKGLRRELLLWGKRMGSADRLEEAYAAARVLEALEPADTTTRALYEQVKRRRLSEARKRLVDHLPDAMGATAKLMADYPCDPAAARLHARALIAARLYAEAERLLATLVGGADVCADDHVQLARVYRATRAADKAIDACFRALSIEPENRLALLLLRQLLPSRK